MEFNNVGEIDIWSQNSAGNPKVVLFVRPLLIMIRNSGAEAESYL